MPSPVKALPLQQVRVEDFRCQVGRRADYGLSKGLLPDDPSVAKIAELDLWFGRGGKRNMKLLFELWTGQ